MSEESPQGETLDTQEPSLRAAFTLGRVLNYLRLASSNGWKIGELEPGSGHGHILYSLQQLREMVSRYDLNEPSESKITDRINHLMSKYVASDNIKGTDAQMLNEDVSRWGQMFRDSFRRTTLIPVSTTGLFDVERAMEHPDELFDPDVWGWMSEQSREDIRQACRALAVDAPTASAMVSLRAVEEALRRWYLNDTGEEIEQRSWGSVLDRLLEEYGSDGPSVLTDLSYLKERRNEVDHPDRSPDWPEAEATLYRVRETITQVFNEIGEVSDDE